MPVDLLSLPQKDLFNVCDFLNAETLRQFRLVSNAMKELVEGSLLRCNRDTVLLRFRTFPRQEGKIFLAFDFDRLPDESRLFFLAALNQLKFPKFDLGVNKELSAELKVEDITAVLVYLKPLMRRTHFRKIVLAPMPHEVVAMCVKFIHGKYIPDVFFAVDSYVDFGPFVDLICNVGIWSLTCHVPPLTQDTVEFLRQAADVATMMNVHVLNIEENGPKLNPVSVTRDILSRRCLSLEIKMMRRFNMAMRRQPILPPAIFPIFSVEDIDRLLRFVNNSENHLFLQTLVAEEAMAAQIGEYKFEVYPQVIGNLRRATISPLHY